jgi:hypothetical protein
MKEPQLNPQVADLAPAGPTLTMHDEEHIITYLRLLDADAEGADWRDVSRIVLHIDQDLRCRPGAAGLRKPSIARQMDDRARLSPSVARWRLIIATPALCLKLSIITAVTSLG